MAEETGIEDLPPIHSEPAVRQPQSSQPSATFAGVTIQVPRLSGPDPDDIKRRTGKWQVILYVINGFTAGLGIVLMGVAGWAKNSEQSLVLPQWALNTLIAFGLIVMVVSFIGLYGAWKAPDKIDNKKVNWMLWFYFIIIFLAFILQLVAAGVLLVLVGVIKDARDADGREGEISGAVKAFETELRAVIKSNQDEWYDVQRVFECCGYGCSNQCNATCWAMDIPTGPFCGSPSSPCTPTAEAVPTCRNLLLTKAAEQATALGAIAIVFAILELFAFTAAFCLLCCVKVDYEID